MNDLSSNQYAERNSNKISGNIFKDPTKSSRHKAAAEFHLTTGYDCLLKYLHRIHVAQALFCTIHDIWEDVDAVHIPCYLALKGSSLCSHY
ncbi:hypothetical protein TNCV_4728221 [Trichonephila clavipes]|nr:hypothetical protein TNCV_4728221 [Trichonephila clavipes]